MRRDLLLQDLEERDVDERAGRDRLQHAVDDVQRRARVARLNDDRADRDADRLEERADAGGDEDAPHAQPALHQLQAEAEADDRLVARDRHEQVPHVEHGVLQADAHPLEDAVQREGEQEDGGARRQPLLARRVQAVAVAGRPQRRQRVEVDVVRRHDDRRGVAQQRRCGGARHCAVRLFLHSDHTQR